MQSHTGWLVGPQKTSFWVAGHTLVRPSARTLEPLTETDGDETMMDNPGVDDAGDTTSAVKSKIQPTKSSDQEDCFTRSMWSVSIPQICAVLVLIALGGQTLANDSVKSNTVCLWRAFTDGDDGEDTIGATPFLLVKVRPSMMIWSMLVQCKGLEDQAVMKETVESWNETWLP